MDTETCGRCGREVSVDADDFSDGESIGGQYVCGRCVTGAEQKAVDEDAMATAEKIRENRLRRMADRQGIRLEKSRRRDPRALDYGNYWLVDGPPPAPGGSNWRSRTVLLGGDYGTSLDNVEEWLTEAR